MEATLTNLLKSIVSKPEEISIERTDLDTGMVSFLITAAEEDKGLIIGKGGRTIKALQDIIAVKGIKENKRVSLKIV